MSDAIPRLNTALEGRYTIEPEIGEGGMATDSATEGLLVFVRLRPSQTVL